jgi:hypothetical protein
VCACPDFSVARATRLARAGRTCPAAAVVLIHQTEHSLDMAERDRPPGAHFRQGAPNRETPDGTRRRVEGDDIERGW